MKLHEFLECNYVEKNMTIQSKGYSPFLKAETLATHQITQFQIKIYKWLSWPKILFCWFMVNLGLMKAPRTIVEIQASMRADMEANKTTTEAQSNGDSNVQPIQEAGI
jgi:hypothetical protein